VSPAQAALGDEISVPTIEGAEAKVRVPAGAQHGQMVRIRGKGVPHLGSTGRGDQLVYLDVVVPRALTKDQRRLYAQLRDIEGPTSQDGDTSDLFGRIKDAMGGGG
jgi:molecular chaperone DnaJ